VGLRFVSRRHPVGVPTCQSGLPTCQSGLPTCRQADSPAEADSPAGVPTTLQIHSYTLASAPLGPRPSDYVTPGQLPRLVLMLARYVTLLRLPLSSTPVRYVTPSELPRFRVRGEENCLDAIMSVDVPRGTVYTSAGGLCGSVTAS
jgi:hypothetical protein